METDTSQTTGIYIFFQVNIQVRHSIITNCSRITQNFRLHFFLSSCSHSPKNPSSCQINLALQLPQPSCFENKLIGPKLQAQRIQLCREREVQGRGGWRPYVLRGGPGDVDVGLYVGNPLAGRDPRHRRRRVRDSGAGA